MKNLNAQIEELQSLYDDYTSNMQFNENLKEACLYLGDTIGSLRAVAEEAPSSSAINQAYQHLLKRYIRSVTEMKFCAEQLSKFASLLNITEDFQHDLDTINRDNFNAITDKLLTLKED